MAAKKKKKRASKKWEVSKMLAAWAAIVATAAAAAPFILSALGRDPCETVAGVIFTACIGYLIAYAGKSLGEKISRNRHGLDADGNPYSADSSEPGGPG